MIDNVDVDALWAALESLRGRVDGQTMRTLRHLADLARRFPGRVEEAEAAGALSDATFDPGLMLHVTREAHAPATQGMEPYGPFNDAASARLAAAEHFACEEESVVIRLEPGGMFLGAYLPEAQNTGLRPW